MPFQCQHLLFQNFDFWQICAHYSLLCALYWFHKRITYGKVTSAGVLAKNRAAAENGTQQPEYMPKNYIRSAQLAHNGDFVTP